MLIGKFVLKVTNNERNILTNHEITDCIAEKVECAKNQIVDSFEITAAKFLIYLFI